MAEKGEKRDPSSHRTPTQIRRQARGYNAKPKQRKKRAMNNKARRALGLKVGDKRDAHHIKPLRSGGGNTRSNLKAVDRSKNRAWRSQAKKSPGSGSRKR